MRKGANSYAAWGVSAAPGPQLYAAVHDLIRSARNLELGE